MSAGWSSASNPRQRAEDRHLIGRSAEQGSRFEARQVDWLILDDLHVLSGKPMTQGEVGRLLRSVVDRGGRVACASGGSVAGIHVLADAVQASAAARVIEMAAPQPREMQRILVRWAGAAGLRISAATSAVLAHQARGDVRRGIGARTRRRFEQSLPAAAASR